MRCETLVFCDMKNISTLGEASEKLATGLLARADDIAGSAQLRKWLEGGAMTSWIDAKY